MVFLRSLSLLLLVVPVLGAAGCAVADDDEIGEESGFTDSAITSSTNGAILATTARLNFRKGPSKTAEIMRVLAKGAKVTSLGGGAQSGYLKIKQGGDEGWAYGSYLTKASGASTNDDDDEDDVQGVGGTSSSGGTVASSGSCDVSFYASGARTANGEAFKPDGLTAAHKTLPFNTRIRVTNLNNDKSVVARINDRGPFIDGRCIDLSRGAFQAIMDDGVPAIQVGVLRKNKIRYEVLE